MTEHPFKPHAKGNPSAPYVSALRSDVEIKLGSKKEAFGAAELDKSVYGEHAMPLDIIMQAVDPKFGSPGMLIVAMDKNYGTVVGYNLVLRGSDGKCCFAASTISPEYRGIGGHLQLASMKEAQAQGFKYAISTAAPGNYPILILKLNKFDAFKVVGFEPDAYGEGVARFYVEADLSKTPQSMSQYDMAALYEKSKQSKTIKLGSGTFNPADEKKLDQEVVDALKAVDWSKQVGEKIVWDPSTQPDERVFYLMLRDI